MQGITKIHPFLSTNKTHTKKNQIKSNQIKSNQRKKKTLKKFHNGALAPISGFLPVPVG
jgi:hypothetical protein